MKAIFFYALILLQFISCNTSESRNTQKGNVLSAIVPANSEIQYTVIDSAKTFTHDTLINLVEKKDEPHVKNKPKPVSISLWGKWVLLKINDGTVDTANYMKGLPYIEINQTDKTFSGSTGCNSMHGAVIVEDNNLAFENIAQTKMMCRGSGEREFMNLFRKVKTFQLSGNYVKLITGEGSLTFQKQ